MPLIRKSSDMTAPAAGGSASGLRDGTTDERWAAARALSAPGDVSVLNAALDTEQDPRVREAILTSLARIGDAASAQAVIPHIRSEDASERTAALDCLRAMPEAVTEALPGLLGDPDPDVRLLACELARALPSARATQLLCDLVRGDVEANVCAAAIEVLAEVGGPEALPALDLCAGRFPEDAFLAFAIKVAGDRISAHPRDRLG